MQGKFISHLDNSKDLQLFKEEQVTQTPDKLTLTLQSVPERTVLVYKNNNQAGIEDGREVVGTDFDPGNVEERTIRYHSGRVEFDINNFQEGKIDIYAKLPAAPGLHPTLWLFPADGNWPPEIDIAESLGNTKMINTNFITGTWDAANYDLGREFPLDYSIPHKFSIEITPTELVWFIDDKEVRREEKPSPQYQGVRWKLWASLAAGEIFPGMGTPMMKDAALEISQIDVAQAA